LQWEVVVAANLDQLKQAQVLEEEGLTDEHKQQIEDLSQDEIDALINIKKKLTKFTWPIRNDIEPIL
jgi:hypothetical protein